MKKSEKKRKNSPLGEGAYMPSEDVIYFEHAISTLEQAREILQVVAMGLKPKETAQNAELKIENEKNLNHDFG